MLIVSVVNVLTDEFKKLKGGTVTSHGGRVLKVRVVGVVAVFLSALFHWPAVGSAEENNDHSHTVQTFIN